MQQRFGIWFSAGAFMLAACGSVEDSAALQKSTAALACRSDTDCGAGYACTHISELSYCEAKSAASTKTSSARALGSAAAPLARACQTDADCAAGEECESEHDQAYYCAPHREEGKAHAGAYASAPSEHCRDEGEDCSRTERCADAGSGPAQCQDGDHQGAHDIGDDHAHDAGDNQGGGAELHGGGDAQDEHDAHHAGTEIHGGNDADHNGPDAGAEIHGGSDGVDGGAEHANSSDEGADRDGDRSGSNRGPH
jgi:hypothetical protein